MIASAQSRSAITKNNEYLCFQKNCESGFVARSKQSMRLFERRTRELIQVSVQGVDFDVFRGVYDTGIDTELMVHTVRIDRTETFLEVGCGAGAVSILLANRCKRGVGVDINPLAVANSQHNARTHQTRNIDFQQSDVFDSVEGMFDLVICNPPYNSYAARDVIEMMFWDPLNSMKHRFFGGVRSRLLPNGRVYFGWADFADVSSDFPIKMAHMYGLRVSDIRIQKGKSGQYHFAVFELVKG